MKTLYGSNFKMHILLDEVIFSPLIKNLQNRFGEVFISNERPLFVNNGSAIWDAGGSIIGNDIKFSFKLSDNFSLLCRSQHWKYFKDSILNAIKTKGDEPYLKIHSQMYALCLTEDQSIRLMTQIIKNSGKFDSIAEVTTSRIADM